jgi:photosystem II stability/assembly factor-like uncharacterized protein
VNPKPRLVMILASLLTLAGFPLSAGPQFDKISYSDLRWRLIGPFRGGRTVGATGVPGQANVFYVGVNNGGVWKTTDFGHVWTPIFDDQPTQSIGTLALAPSDPNIIYVGSGEGLQRPDLSIGDGIYKSTDAGKTWRHLGLRDARQIGAILVDPRNPRRVFVAALGHPYGANEERGVFRSTDGGETWAKVLYKDENTGAIDLAFDPANSQVIYAVMWAARQGPWEYNNAYSGPASGLFRSADGGTTWRQLAHGLPTFAEGLGRIGIGIAPTDSRRLYALVEASPKAGGLFRSDDAGESWERVNNENRIWGRGSDFAMVRVDPANKETVYVCNTSTYRSTDGGHSFVAIKGAPGGDDYHTIWINPENPQIILLASDQGATISVNGGQTWSSWYNQPTGQMFHVTADNRFPYWVYGGQQESGSAGVASRSDYGEITFREWHPVGVEEYGYAAPDPLHPGVIYGGKVSRYDEKTGQVQNVGPVALRTGKYRFDRTAPILFSPVDPHVLYFAAQVLFKTINGGRSWEIISPDLTREKSGVPQNLGIYSDEASRSEHRGVIYSLGPSPRDVNLIWAGTDDGLVHVTSDGGKSWKDVTPPELTAWSKVTQIDAGHFDAATAYVSVSRFRLDDLHPYIYRTHDGGKNWQKITGGLPDNAPVNVVREDPARKGLLFAGTEREIYVSFDDGEQWQSIQQNLPRSSMRDLIIRGDDLVVATHGRSFWILDDITPLRQLTAKVVESEAYLFRPQAALRWRWNRNTDTPLPPEVPAGPNPPDGAIIDYYLRAASPGPVTLEIFNAAGKLARRFSSSDKPEVTEPQLQRELAVPTYWVRATPVLSAEAGMRRFVWDLHYPPPPALRHEYPIAAIYRDTPREPRGPIAAPGLYTVKLTAAGRSYTQPLTLKMDPRIKTLPAGLIQQFTVATKISDAMRQDYEALAQVRQIRSQLNTLRSHAGVQSQSALREAIGALDGKAAALEGGAPVSPFGAGSAGEENLTRLNGELSTVLELVDSADAAPTTQAMKTVAELQQALKSLLARWQDLKNKDVPALNEHLRRSNLQPVTTAPEPDKTNSGRR